MPATIARLLVLVIAVWLAVPAHADIGTLSTVIEGFVEKQYPRPLSHFWVVNGTQWQDTNEVVVDVNAFATDRTGRTAAEKRFLLLIVDGRLAASQNIPLGATTDCQPDHT